MQGPVRCWRKTVIVKQLTVPFWPGYVAGCHSNVVEDLEEMWLEWSVPYVCWFVTKLSLCRQVAICCLLLHHEAFCWRVGERALQYRVFQTVEPSWDHANKWGVLCGSWLCNAQWGDEAIVLWKELGTVHIRNHDLLFGMYVEKPRKPTKSNRISVWASNPLSPEFEAGGTCTRPWQSQRFESDTLRIHWIDPRLSPDSRVNPR
jgi:hypothetical protein